MRCHKSPQFLVSERAGHLAAGEGRGNSEKEREQDCKENSEGDRHPHRMLFLGFYRLKYPTIVKSFPCV